MSRLLVAWRMMRLMRRRSIDAIVTVGAGDKMFWAARFADEMLMTREALWYENGVDKKYSRGGERRSRRFRRLWRPSR